MTLFCPQFRPEIPGNFAKVESFPEKPGGKKCAFLEISQIFAKKCTFFVRFWTKIIVPKHPPYSLYFVAYFCPTYALYSQQYCCYQFTERLQYNTGNLTKRGCFLGQFLSPGDIFIHFCPRGHFGQFLEKRAIFDNFWKKGQFLSISGNRGAPFFHHYGPPDKRKHNQIYYALRCKRCVVCYPWGVFCSTGQTCQKKDIFPEIDKNYPFFPIPLRGYFPGFVQFCTKVFFWKI